MCKCLKTKDYSFIKMDTSARNKSIFLKYVIKRMVFFSGHRGQIPKDSRASKESVFIKKPVSSDRFLKRFAFNCASDNDSSLPLILFLQKVNKKANTWTSIVRCHAQCCRTIDCVSYYQFKQGCVFL